MKRERGSVIIIVLWTAVLLTVLVTAMAGKVRLSAQAAFRNVEGAGQWARMMDAVNRAEMELMLEIMPRPVDEVIETDEDGELINPLYRFNGQPLSLYYPADEDLVIRAYNHGGKINLNRIPRRRMQQIIEKRLGGLEADPEEVQELLAAWVDWTDLNDLGDPGGGAERTYYESLDPAYSPRNNPELDTVEELLHIRGFAELFSGINLEAAFTIYGADQSINLNLATREAMQLLPGLDDELIERIIAFRSVKQINTQAQINELIPFENWAQLSDWVSNALNSQYYTLFVYPRATVAGHDPVREPDPVTRGYMEVLEVRGYNNLPRVLRVDPYGRLPDTTPPDQDVLEDLVIVPSL